MRFADRADAGRLLAHRVAPLSRDHLVVLGLPRGGVPVAYEIADALGVPLDIIVVRKLGVPYQPELAMGAIGEDGVRIVNADIVRHAGVSAYELAAVEARERAELQRRAASFRGDRERVPLVGCTALIVDDGIATGSTVRAACEVARAHGAALVIVAAPVAPPSTIASLRDAADHVIVLHSPESFSSIGEFYDDFAQTTDAEVVDLLERARSRDANNTAGGISRVRSPRDEDVAIDAGPDRLGGHTCSS